MTKVGKLAKARRAVEKARRNYLNGPAMKRLELRAAYVKASQAYERIKTGRVETLHEKIDRLTK